MVPDLFLAGPVP